MSTPQCSRCGAATQGPAKYVLDGQRLCALCYGLALSAGSDRSACLPGDDPLVRLDEMAVDGGERDRSAEAADAPAPDPRSSPPDSVDSYVPAGSRRAASLLPAGVAHAGPARPRIDDDSIRLGTPHGWRLHAARDRGLLS